MADAGRKRGRPAKTINMKPDDPIPKGKVITDARKRKWIFGDELGSGGFGVMYEGLTSQLPKDSCTSVSSSGSMSCVNPDSSCGLSSAPKLVLRPSALTAQAELLKLMNKHETGSKQDDKENKLNENIHANSEEANFAFPESSGKISKNVLFSSGITPKSLSSKMPKFTALGDGHTTVNSDNSDETGSDSGCFVFGQNLHERALNYEDTTVKPLSTTDSHNPSFEEAALRREELEKREHQAYDAKLSKSLSESAKEYKSKQVKRKFDEVTVITGEEEESNVLRMNCKLFAFNNSSSSWQERGWGILRLNDKEVNGALQSRVVMRTQGSLRVILNTKVWPGMSVEHPSQKTVRLTAIDMQGIKVFLVVANPKDAEQLFSALDWRVTSLKSQEDSTSETSVDDVLSVIEATNKFLRFT